MNRFREIAVKRGLIQPGQQTKTSVQADGGLQPVGQQGAIPGQPASPGVNRFREIAIRRGLIRPGATPTQQVMPQSPPMPEQVQQPVTAQPAVVDQGSVGIEVGKGLYRGARTGVHSILSGAAQGVVALNETISDFKERIDPTGTMARINRGRDRLSQVIAPDGYESMEDFAKAVAGEVRSAEQKPGWYTANPELADKFVVKLAEGVGQVASQLPAYVFTPAAIVAVAGQLFEESYKQEVSKYQSPTPEQIKKAEQNAMKYVAVAGPLEFFADKVMGGMIDIKQAGNAVVRAVQNMTGASLAEGTTEVVQDMIGSLIRGEDIDPAQLWETFKVAGVTGGVVRGGAVVARRDFQNIPDQPPLTDAEKQAADAVARPAVQAQDRLAAETSAARRRSIVTDERASRFERRRQEDNARRAQLQKNQEQAAPAMSRFEARNAPKVDQGQVVNPLNQNMQQSVGMDRTDVGPGGIIVPGQQPARPGAEIIKPGSVASSPADRIQQSQRLQDVEFGSRATRIDEQGRVLDSRGMPVNTEPAAQPDVQPTRLSDATVQQDADQTDTGEPEVQSQFDRTEVDVVRVPLEELSLSKDVPNFKRNADEDTGLVAGQQLKGEFDERGAAPILVWERADGTKEVISGRHRLDLARRTPGKKNIQAQVFREADGFTKQDAMVADAVDNMRNGNGEVRDYVQVVKEVAGTEQEAERLGIFNSVKGRQGWVIGKNAKDDLYASVIGEQISPSKAAAIAENAPDDAGLQRAGMRYAANHSAAETGMYVGALRAAGVKSTGGQLDLFGVDETVLIEAEQIAKAARKRQVEVQDQLSVLRAGAKLGKNKFANTLKAYGIKAGNTKAINKKIEELQIEVMEWERFGQNPDKMAEARELAGLAPRKVEKAVEKSRAQEAYRVAYEAILDADADVVLNPEKFGLTNDEAREIEILVETKDADQSEMEDDDPDDFEADNPDSMMIVDQEFEAEAQSPEEMLANLYAGSFVQGGFTKEEFIDAARRFLTGLDLGFKGDSVTDSQLIEAGEDAYNRRMSLRNRPNRNTVAIKEAKPQPTVKETSTQVEEAETDVDDNKNGEVFITLDSIGDGSKLMAKFAKRRGSATGKRVQVRSKVVYTSTDSWMEYRIGEYTFKRDGLKLILPPDIEPSEWNLAVGSSSSYRIQEQNRPESTVPIEDTATPVVKDETEVEQRKPIEQAQAAVDKAGTMEEKQAALDAWKRANQEAVSGVEDAAEAPPAQPESKKPKKIKYSAIPISSEGDAKSKGFTKKLFHITKDSFEEIHPGLFALDNEKQALSWLKDEIKNWEDKGRKGKPPSLHTFYVKPGIVEEFDKNIVMDGSDSGNAWSTQYEDLQFAMSSGIDMMVYPESADYDFEEFGYQNQYVIVNPSNIRRASKESNAEGAVSSSISKSDFDGLQQPKTILGPDGTLAGMPEQGNAPKILGPDGKPATKKEKPKEQQEERLAAQRKAEDQQGKFDLEEDTDIRAKARARDKGGYVPADAAGAIVDAAKAIRKKISGLLSTTQGVDAGLYAARRQMRQLNESSVQNNAIIQNAGARIYNMLKKDAGVAYANRTMAKLNSGELSVSALRAQVDGTKGMSDKQKAIMNRAIDFYERGLETRKSQSLQLAKVLKDAGVNESLVSFIEANPDYAPRIYERFLNEKWFQPRKQDVEAAEELVRQRVEQSVEKFIGSMNKMQKAGIDVDAFLKTGTIPADIPSEAHGSLVRVSRAWEQMKMLISAPTLSGDVWVAKINSEAVASRAQNIIEEILEPRGQRRIDGASSVYSTDNLMHRVLDEQVFRQLYGEIRDPAFQLGMAVEVQAKLINQHVFFQRLFAEGDMLSSPVRDSAKGHTVRIGGKGKRGRDNDPTYSAPTDQDLKRYGMMAGRYVSPEVAKLMGVQPDTDIGMVMNAWKQGSVVLRSMAGLQRRMALWRFKTLFRNYHTNVTQFAAGAGDLQLRGFWRHYTHAHKLAAQAASGNLDAMEKVRKMAESGAFMVESNSILSGIRDSMGPGKGKAKELLRKMDTAYAFIDFFGKYAAYNARIDHAKRTKGMSQKDAEAYALDHVQKHYQHKDFLPDFVNKLSGNPWAGDFFAYKFDAARIAINEVKGIVQSARDGDIGEFSRRASGFAVSRSIQVTANYALLNAYNKAFDKIKEALGWDDDDKHASIDEYTAIREISEPYYKDEGMFIVKGIDENGEVYYDRTITGSGSVSAFPHEDIFAGLMQVAWDKDADMDKALLSHMVDQYALGMFPKSLIKYMFGLEVPGFYQTDESIPGGMKGTNDRWKNLGKGTLELIGKFAPAAVTENLTILAEIATDKGLEKKDSNLFASLQKTPQERFQKQFQLIPTTRFNRKQINTRIRQTAAHYREGISAAKADIDKLDSVESNQAFMQKKMARLSRTIQAVRVLDPEYYTNARLVQVLTTSEDSDVKVPSTGLTKEEAWAIVAGRVDRLRPREPKQKKG